MKHIAIFATGKGSNALNIINYFKNSISIKVTLVVSNRSDAEVLEKAMLAGIPVMVLESKKEFSQPAFIEFLKKQSIDLIVLAGFLLLLPENLVKAFHQKIINIHPALLPKYGGKGMYGMKVHEAVLKNKEIESGISIHYVNERFDEGEIIFRQKCPVDASDTPASLAAKVQQLEHEHFPKIIEQILSH